MTRPRMSMRVYVCSSVFAIPMKSMIVEPSKMSAIDARAKAGVPFDNQIQEGIDQPDIKAAIQSLRDQIPPLEEAIKELGVTTGDLCQDTDQFECE